ncbi:hypothetical protein [Steroidobacter gossypii]|uniref:hypothetical protein n=1 Tax=Steroidobacter gossypii TaxID=2805490 RepID=UPI001C3FB2C5|nr:hypothetical protein [Steroidobacter gossypii]
MSASLTGNKRLRTAKPSAAQTLWYCPRRPGRTKKSIVGLPSSLLPSHRLQRRLAVLLSMILCLWMLASATHFHVQAEELSGHHTAKELCGFCASLPGAGAAPAVSVFITTAERQQVAAPAEILPIAPSLPAASYQSRAPPVV